MELVEPHSEFGGGYILKWDAPEDLMVGVETVLRRERYIQVVASLLKTGTDNRNKRLARLHYLLLIITAVRSSCCFVPPENSITAWYKSEIISLGCFNLDVRMACSNLLGPNSSA